MDRWKNKVAIVTGASCGIGAAIAKSMVESGLQVVGLARRAEKIEAYAKKLVGTQGKLIARKVDMTKENEIIDCFRWITNNIGPVHILINNAAVVENTSLIGGDTEIWRQIIETNLLGYSIATREAYQIMSANNIDGHIVNISSIAGHKTIYIPGMSMYGPSKFATTCYSDLLRQELVSVGSRVKITNVSPGVVNTNIFEATSNEMKTAINPLPKLESKHVAQAVIFVLSTPPEVQITELTIQPTGEAF